ncbi:NVEALA domain-containing protein [Phocaeicola sp.]
MKKNILKVSLVAAFALFAGYNVYSSQKSDVMSDLALANVEALASDEVVKVCPNKGGTCTVQIGEQTVVGTVGWQK